MDEVRFARTRAQIEKVTDEFSAVEAELTKEKAKQRAATNPITRALRSFRVRRTTRRLGKLYEEGEGLDELYRYQHPLG